MNANGDLLNEEPLTKAAAKTFIAEASNEEDEEN